jgi:cytochrome P450
MTAVQTRALDGEGVFHYDPYDRDVLNDPNPYYKRLRADFPAYYIDKYDMFAFTRFADIWELLSIGDNALIGSEFTVPRPDMIRHRNDGPPPLPSTRPMAPGPTLPSPQYEEMRRAHIAPLLPKAISQIEQTVRQLAVERLRALLPLGRFDLTSDYGGMVCAAVTCDMFGIPREEAAEALAIVNALANFSPEIEAVDIPGFFVDLQRYITPAIERRRAAGADGSVPLIDGMINHRVKADGRALTDAEICDQLVCAFVGITEQPPKPAAIGLWQFARHPDQLAAVRADLDANVVIATEEILRLGTTAQWAIRTAHKDVTIAGQRVRAGQRVLFSMFSAARDEREFDDPEAFVWNRPNRRLLVFGRGLHFCIGSHLTRLFVRTLVREFLAHVKDYEFDMSEAVHSRSYFHWGWMKLPVIVKDHAL